MSIKVMGAVWEHSRQKEGALLVLLALADYAHDDGTMAFPSVKTLARKARLSSRSVQYALRRLEQAGEIQKTGVHESGVTIYQVLTGGAKSAGAQNLRGRNLEQKGGAKSAPKSLRTEPPIYIPGLFDAPESNAEPPPPPLPIVPEPPKPNTQKAGAKTPRARAKREKEDPYWRNGERLKLFSDWYAEYPRKVDPQGAMKAWRDYLGDADADERTMRSFWGIFRKRCQEWKSCPPDKVPHPATWLRRTEWEFTREYVEAAQ